MRKPVWLLLAAALTLMACATSQPVVAPQPIATETIVRLPETPTSAPTSNCTSLQVAPTPGVEEESLFPSVSADEMVAGPADAAVIIIEYGDYQSPACGSFAPVLAQLAEAYPNDLQVVYRDFPLLSIHDKAGLAAQAVFAANIQGRAWQMHDLLFEKQDEWSAMSIETFADWLYDRSAALEMDADQFRTDLKGADSEAHVQQAWRNGQEIGLPGTPFVLINGQIYSGPLDFSGMSQIIALIRLGERQFTSCPPLVIDPAKEYIATLETEKGDVVIQFFPQQAPAAVNSFVFLAREGWFDGITFHRVLPGFVAQTGDPSGTGQGNPGYFFKNEIDPALSFDRAGVVGMANSGPDANGSQFFITYAPAPQLDGSYTIFGQVISGMDVLAALAPRDPQIGLSLPPGDMLLRVTIEER
ncbi:MAG: peptidylprolyl isomerase [Anaerolineales bacterium]|nr:peptidylprolyl isomerase [Anaerolineales bacterium]